MSRVVAASPIPSRLTAVPPSDCPPADWAAPPHGRGAGIPAGVALAAPVAADVRRRGAACFTLLAAGVLTVAGCGQTKAPPAPVKKPAAVADKSGDVRTPGPAAESAARSPAPAEVAAAPAEVAAVLGGPEVDVAAVKQAGTAAVETILGRLAAATDEDGRVTAIDDIAKLGAAAEPALQPLLKAATDTTSARIRWHAIRAIGRIGHDASSAVPALIAALADSDPIVVTQSVVALGDIRRDDPRHDADLPATEAAAFIQARDALMKACSHADARVRRAALRSVKEFVSVDDLGPLFVKFLSDSDPSVILPSLQSLADLGEPVVPLLLKALEDPKARYWATVALMEMGPKAAAATDPLTTLLATGEIDERMQTGLALAAIGEPAAAAADELAGLLESPEGALRFTGAYALGRIRGPGADAALEKAAADADPFLATIATWARARIHPDDPALVDAAVTRLTAGLTSDRHNLRAAAVRSIADLRGSIPDDREAEVANAVVKLLNDPRGDVARAAAEALVQMGPTAIAALEQALEDPALELPAVQLLSSLGKLSEPAVDSLTKSLGDTDPVIRGEAAVALASVGSEAVEAVPSLIEMISAAVDAPAEPVESAGMDMVGSAAGNRLAAIFALGKIGPAAARAVDRLTALAGADDDDMLATMASWALLKIEPGNPAHFEAAIPRLRKALRAERETVRAEAARALGEIGYPASSAIPMLELLSDDDPSAAVRAAAAEALPKLKGGPGAR